MICWKVYEETWLQVQEPLITDQYFTKSWHSVSHDSWSSWICGMHSDSRFACFTEKPSPLSLLFYRSKLLMIKRNRDSWGNWAHHVTLVVLERFSWCHEWSSILCWPFTTKTILGKKTRTQIQVKHWRSHCAYFESLPIYTL